MEVPQEVPSHPVEDDREGQDVVRLLGRLLGKNLVGVLREAFRTDDTSLVMGALSASTKPLIQAAKEEAFVAACNEGCEEEVALLLACDDLNFDAPSKGHEFDYRGHCHTPLMRAACNGHTGVVKLLLASGAVNVERTDSTGFTALAHAADHGHSSCVRELLASGSKDVNQSFFLGRGSYLTTPLLLSARNGSVDCLNAILAMPLADVNKPDHRGNSALHTAAENANLACLRALLAVPSVDVNRANQRKQTPLLVAAFAGSAQCVAALLAISGVVNVNFVDDALDAPINIAAASNNTEVVVALLSASNLCVNVAASGTGTPLLHAVLHGNIDMTAALLIGGACRFTKQACEGQLTAFEITSNDKIKALFRAGIDYWQPKNHPNHSPRMKAVAKILFCVQQRLSVTCDSTSPVATAATDRDATNGSATATAARAATNATNGSATATATAARAASSAAQTKAVYAAFVPKYFAF